MESNINERMSHLLKRTVRMKSVSYKDWLDSLMCIPSERCNGSLKTFVYALEQHYRRISPEQSGKYIGMRKLWMQDVYDRCGMPKSTCSRMLPRLEEVEAVSIQRPTEGVKGMKTRIYMHFNPLFLAEPGVFFPTAHLGKNGFTHGGGRTPVKCPHCQEYHELERRTTFTCSGCGSPIDELTKKKMIPNPSPEECANGIIALPTMDEIDEMYQFAESCDIPDDIYEEQGERLMSLSAPEISKLINTPRHIREGIDDDEYEAALAVLSSMRKQASNG